MSEIQTALDFLTIHFPWLPTFLKVLGGVIMGGRFTIKPFSQRARERATARLVEIANEGTDQEQKEIIDRLNSPIYRAVVFWVDTITSYKMPTRIEFNRLQMLAAQKRGREIVMVALSQAATQIQPPPSNT